MEQHRAKVSCAVCHSKLDPLGFGLENFDAVGGWRDKDGGDRGRFVGHASLGRVIPRPRGIEGESSRPTHGQFTRCLSEKLLTYALGRGLEEYDRCAVDQIVKSLEADRYRFSTLILAIVKSDPFQKRRDRE